MLGLPEEKILYTEIQKKLFYIIPEKWEMHGSDSRTISLCAVKILRSDSV